jgi:hypothetical protein
MKEDNLRPSLRYVQSSTAGEITTLIGLFFSFYLGGVVTQYLFNSHVKNLIEAFNYSELGIMFFVFLFIVSLVITILIHKPLEFSFKISSFIVVLASVIFIVFMKMTESSEAAGYSIFIIPAIPFIMIGSLITSIIFRLFKNRYGIIGSLLINIIVMIISVFIN